MPLKNKFIFKNGNDRERTVEKSVSTPVVNEMGNQLSDCNSRQNENKVKSSRKLSWFNRLLPKFIRKRRKTTEVDPGTSSTFQVQKSASCQFYTPPPKDFLEKATNKCDEGDGDNEIVGEQSAHSGSFNRNQAVRSSSKMMVFGMNDNLVNELKKSLKVDVQSNDNSQCVYSNVANLGHNMASSGRKSRQGTGDLNQFDDLEALYEVTWKNNSEFSDRYNGTSKEQIYSEPIRVQPQPMPPLHKFPKPKPPINRKPSSRRGSKPTIFIREKPSINTVPKSNRRSNAELEEVIQNLHDIPAPEIDETFTQTTPTPKKRTIFKSSEQLSSVDDDSSKPWNETRDWLNETVAGPLPAANSSSMSVKEIINTFNKFKAKTTDNLPGANKDFSPFKRWRTLPTKYVWKSKEFHSFERANTKIPTNLRIDPDNSNENESEIIEEGSNGVSIEDVSHAIFAAEGTQASSTDEDTTPDEVTQASSRDKDTRVTSAEDGAQNISSSEGTDDTPTEDSSQCSMSYESMDEIQLDVQRDLMEVLADLVPAESSVNHNTPPNTPEQESIQQVLTQQDIPIDTDLDNRVTQTEQTDSPTSCYVVDVLKKETSLPPVVFETFPDSGECEMEIVNDGKLQDTDKSYILTRPNGTVIDQTTEELTAVVADSQISESLSNSKPNRNATNPKIPPPKPIRLQPKPLSWKPEPPPKPKDFVRRGAIRYKTSSSIQEQTYRSKTSPTIESLTTNNDSTSPSDADEEIKSLKNRRSKSIN